MRGLGSAWTREQAAADMSADQRPPRPNFLSIADLAAARIAAETIYAEPPSPYDLSDEALVAMFASCSVRRSELPLVREAFRRTYIEGSGPSISKYTCTSLSAPKRA